MGEAKRRGLEIDGYGNQREYEVLGASAWYVGANDVVRRECSKGGRGESIVAMMGERAALGGCPSVFGASEARVWDEGADFAIASAVCAAPDMWIVVVDDATGAIETMDPVAFLRGYERLAGQVGSGRCARKGGTASAAFHPRKGCYLAMGEDGRHAVVDAPTFLRDKGLWTPAGVVALGDPLTMQVATVLRQVALGGKGVAKGLSEASQDRLRQSFDALVAHHGSRYADAGASADLEVGKARPDEGSLEALAGIEGVPIHAALRKALDAVAARLPGEGDPEDAVCRHLGSPVGRWAAGDLRSASEACEGRGGPPIPEGARSTTIAPEERERLRGYLAEGSSPCRPMTFEGGATCRVHDRDGGRHALFQGMGEAGEAQLVAWRLP